MKNTLRHIAAILILIVFPAHLTAQGEWKLILEEDNIALYARELKGHTESQYKGITTVIRPIETVGSVLSDTASYPGWFFKCIEAKKLSTEDSSKLHFFLYIVIDTPWPFSDRDVIYETEITINHASEKVVIRSSALKEALIPLKRQYVRITDSEHQWILEKISDAQTRITFINRTNAAGTFASYLSNPGMRDTTFHSLKNLSKILSIRKAEPAAPGMAPFQEWSSRYNRFYQGTFSPEVDDSLKR